MLNDFDKLRVAKIYDRELNKLGRLPRNLIINNSRNFLSLFACLSEHSLNEERMINMCSEELFLSQDEIRTFLNSTGFKLKYDMENNTLNDFEASFLISPRMQQVKTYVIRRFDENLSSNDLNAFRIYTDNKIFKAKDNSILRKLIRIRYKVLVDGTYNVLEEVEYVPLSIFNPAFNESLLKYDDKIRNNCFSLSKEEQDREVLRVVLPEVWELCERNRQVVRHVSYENNVNELNDYYCDFNRRNKIRINDNDYKVYDYDIFDNRVLGSNGKPILIEEQVRNTLNLSNMKDVKYLSYIANQYHSNSGINALDFYYIFGLNKYRNSDALTLKKSKEYEYLSLLMNGSRVDAFTEIELIEKYHKLCDLFAMFDEIFSNNLGKKMYDCALMIGFEE